MDSVPPTFADGKQCITCQHWKSFDQYCKRKGSPDGHRNECKACRKARGSAYYQANKEKYKEYGHYYHREHQEAHQKTAQEYYAANTEAIKAKVKKYWWENRDTQRAKQKQYYEKNKETLLAKAKRYHESRKDYFRDYKRQWHRKAYARRSKDLNQRSREWHKQNPARARAMANNRKARKLNNGGKYTGAQWLAICAHYGNCCLCCGVVSEKLTVDHVLPVIHGGTNNPDNLQPLCRSCNLRKHTKDTDYRPDKGAFCRALM